MIARPLAQVPMAPAIRQVHRTVDLSTRCGEGELLCVLLKCFTRLTTFYANKNLEGFWYIHLKKQLKTCVKMCVADKNVWKYAYMCLSGCTNEALNMGKRFQGKYETNRV